MERVQINLAKMKKNGTEFEIVVDPDLAVKYREGGVDIREVLKSEEVFYDAQKGELVSESEMEKVFGTKDSLEVADHILKNGEIQLSAEYRQKLRDDKRKKILQIIKRNSVDPKTGHPIPLKRLENAMEEAKVKIEEYKKAEDQVQDIVRKLKPILPIKFEKKQIELTLDAQDAAKKYNTVKSYCDVLKEEWRNDGSWYCKAEIPAGLVDEFYEKINR